MGWRDPTNDCFWLCSSCFQWFLKSESLCRILSSILIASVCDGSICKVWRQHQRRKVATICLFDGLVRRFCCVGKKEGRKKSLISFRRRYTNYGHSTQRKTKDSIRFLGGWRWRCGGGGGRSVVWSTTNDGMVRRRGFSLSCRVSWSSTTCCFWTSQRSRKNRRKQNDVSFPRFLSTPHWLVGTVVNNFDDGRTRIYDWKMMGRSVGYLVSILKFLPWIDLLANNALTDRQSMTSRFI